MPGPQINISGSGKEEVVGKKRCGFVSIMGASNAGKSTLINRLTGQKLSIVTAKAQTTRQPVSGAAIQGDSQMILVDTPGFFSPRTRLDRVMVKTARLSLEEADLIVFMVDARAPCGKLTLPMQALKDRGKMAPVMLVLNKIDLIARPSLLTLADSCQRQFRFCETFMISALRGEGTDDLARAIAKALPLGPWILPQDQVTNLSQKLFASEITREKLFLRLHQELPYTAAVKTETWEEFKNGDLRCHQVIITERDSQKAIIIGKNGHCIKAIGNAARQEIAAAFGRKVHLFLRVKVAPNWRQDSGFLKSLGLEAGAKDGLKEQGGKA